MTDEELIAEARRVGYLLSRCSGDVDRLAGGLLRQMADRLEDRAAAQPTAFTHFPPQSGMDDRSAEDNGIIG